MDPTACLRRIDDAVRDAIIDGDYTDANAACRDLSDWINNGGFAAGWSSHPVAYHYFLRWCDAPLDADDPADARETGT